MKEEYVVLKVKKEDLEDSLAGLSQLKPIIQQQLLIVNHEGQGEEDAKQVGKHFDTAITAMTMLLGNME